MAAETCGALLEHSLAAGVPAGVTAEGLGLQNLPHVDALLRRLADVRERVLAKQRRA